MSYSIESIPPTYGSEMTVPAVPAVSIITPYYNTGQIFMETVQSVLVQSLQQWEWAIVNDGSDDPAALAALEPLRRGADPRIRVLDQPKRGLPGARNAGAAAGRAPLLFFLDSDDLVEPTALEKMAWLLHSDSRPAFVTAWSTGFGAKNYAWPSGFEVGNRFLFENTVTPMVMMRRAVFEAVGGFDETRIYGLEDYEFWLRCAALGYWGRDIPEFLIRLRRKAPHQYPGYNWPLRDDPNRYRAFLREMRSRYPDLFRHGIPELPALGELAGMSVAQDAPFANALPAMEKCLLLLFQPNAAFTSLARLRQQDRACTICAIEAAPRAPLANEQLHGDMFVLGNFLLPADYPRFLLYLVQSRGFEALLVDDNPICRWLAAYLHAFCEVRPHSEIESLLALGRANEAWRSEQRLDTAAGLAAAARAIEAIRKRSSHDHLRLAAQFWAKLIPDQRRRAAWKLAYKRLALWGYPLYRVLGSRRLRLIRRPVRKILGLLRVGMWNRKPTTRTV